MPKYMNAERSLSSEEIEPLRSAIGGKVQKRWRKVVTTIISIGLGVVIGATITNINWHKHTQMLFNEEYKQNHTISQMKKGLKLSDEQAAQVEQVFNSKKDRIRVLQQEFYPRLVELKSEIQGEVRAVLNPKQREKFDKIIAREERIRRGEGLE